ncbi:uncharacterized protein LOC126737251 [Anthonomus grandis grandis]|uniref:uncharacterized protein LOC126737251 n=1 Tax=Anthonomus grandis grandis TaxID=2921223 RepID=UPI0021650705|nr:uncharacterized protein LOC126737251 [Anthonomus grandis grandis]
MRSNCNSFNEVLAGHREDVMALLRSVILASVLTTFTLVNPKENCDSYGSLLYEDLRCTAITKDAEPCPRSYTCNLNLSDTGCIYKGTYYAVGMEIGSDLTYSACNIGCHCAAPNNIQCGILDCPEYLEQNPKPECYSTYELGKCCAIGQVCNAPDNRKRCRVDGYTYEVGQEFYPSGTCFSCVCHDRYNGTFDEATCVRRNCASQINHVIEISQYCAPTYLKFGPEALDVLCCPDEYICPETSERMEMIELGTRGVKGEGADCVWGDRKVKFGYGFNKTSSRYGKDRLVQCECVMPPLVTCKQINSEQRHPSS